MTNKERLEANNAKIEEIQETLKNKILAVVDKSITVELPEEFATLSSIYSFKFDDNLIFLSGAKNNLGLWLYNIKEKTCVQIYNSYYSYDTYQKVGNDCLISGYNTTLLYHADTQNCEDLGIGSSRFTIVDDFCIITASTLVGRVSKYDIKNKILTRITPPEAGWGNISYLHIMKDKIILNGNNNGERVHVYNYKTDEVKLIQEGPYYLEYALIVSDRYMLLNTGSYGQPGVWLYDYDNDTLEQLDTTTRYLNVVCIVDENRALLGTSSNSVYLKLFDIPTKTITNIYNVSNRWSAFFKFDDDRILISTSSDSGSPGLLLYKLSTNGVTQVYNRTYKWTEFHKTGDVCLIGSSAPQSGFLLFDPMDDTAKLIYSTARYWWYFKDVTGGCLIGNSVKSGDNNAGLLFYDSETKTVKKLYSTGNYGNFIPDVDNYYVEIAEEERASLKSSPRTLYYNSIDKTAKLVKYYIGE